MNEELDELASAYVDGEASPEEVALVESNPELLAIVAEFNALKAPPVDNAAAFKARHLEHALAAFDTAQATDTPQAPDTAHATDTAQVAQPTSATPSNEVVRLRPRRIGGAPRWFVGAAAAAMVLGGLGIAVGQLPGSNQVDDATFAAGTSDADNGNADTEDSSSDQRGMLTATSTTLAASNDDNMQSADAAASDDATDGATEDATDEAMDDDAMDDDAMDDDAVDDAEQASGEVDTSEETSDLPPAASTQTPTEILAQQTPATISELIRPPATSQCPTLAGQAAKDLGGEQLGFLILRYGEQRAELHLTEVEGTEKGLILAVDTCELLTVEE